MNIVIPLGTGRKSLSVSTKLLDLLSYPLVTSKHHLYLPQSWTSSLDRRSEQGLARMAEYLLSAEEPKLNSWSPKTNWFPKNHAPKFLTQHLQLPTSSSTCSMDPAVSH